MKKLIILINLIFLFGAIDLFAQNNRDTTYFQGFLTNNKGVPIHDTVQGKVSLYGINDVFIHTVFSGNVQVVNGYFSVPLAYPSQDKSIIDKLSKAVSALIEIDEKPFTKISIGSVLFAKFAQIADSSIRVSNFSITNSQIADSAKIDGKKIFSDFGNQNIITTGSVIGSDGKFKILNADTLTLKDLLADNITANKNLNVLGNITNSTPSAPLLISDSVQITGDLNVLGNLKISGKSNLSVLNVSENSTFEKDSKFEQNLEIDKILTVGGASNLKNTVIDGTLNVHGASTFATTINADGLGTFTSGISITKGGIISNGSNIFNGTTIINGDFTVKNGLTTLEKLNSSDALIDGLLTVTKNITGNADLTIQGFSTLKKDVHILDNLYVHKDMTVDGKSILNGRLGIMGDLDVSGLGTFKDVKVSNRTTLNLLDVTGNTTLAHTTIKGKLDVKDTVSINPDLNVSNKTTTKTLDVKEQATIKTLYVSDSTTLNTLSVKGASNFKGNTTLEGDFTVTTGISKLKNTHIEGTLDVSGLLTAKNKVLISSMMTTPPDMYSLYVDGKTYFKEGIIAGDLTLENTLTVNGDTKLRNLDVSDTTSLNLLSVGGTSTLKTTTVDGNFTVLNGVSKLKNSVIEGTLDVSGQLTAKNKVLISSMMTTPPDMYSLYVDGKTYFKEGIIAGDLTLENTLTVNGDTKLRNLDVSDTTSLNLLSVGGTSTLKTTTVDGNFTVLNGVSKLKNSVIEGTFDVSGQLTAKDKVLISLMMTTSPDMYSLYVDGKTYFKEGIIAGALTLDDSLTVKGYTKLKNLDVIEKTTTKDLEVLGTTLMNTGLITGSMDVTGELNVGGKISGKGKLILSQNPMLLPLDTSLYTLYVDGKTYFKEGILAGDLNLDHSLTVTGVTTLDSLVVNNGSGLHNTYIKGNLEVEGAGLVLLPNNSIQYNELETNDVTKKIRDINFRKADNVKDPLGLQPDKTHLHNLAIAIFRYMGTPGDKTYDGDDIKDGDNNVIIDHNTTSTSVIQNLINNFSSTDKTTYINNIFKDVTDVQLNNTTTFKGKNITFQGDNITFESKNVVIGCLEIDCDPNGNPTIKNKDGGIINITNPTFITPINLPQNSTINNSTIINSTSTNTTLSGITTVSGTTTVTGVLNLSGATVTLPTPLNLVNPNIASATISGEVHMESSTLALPKNQRLESPYLDGLASNNPNRIEGNTLLKGTIQVENGATTFNGGSVNFINGCTVSGISNLWTLNTNGTDLYPNSNSYNLFVGNSNGFAGYRFGVTGNSFFNGQVGINGQVNIVGPVIANGITCGALSPASLSISGVSGLLSVNTLGRVEFSKPEITNPMFIGNATGSINFSGCTVTGLNLGSNIWSQNGAHIYYSSGNVGINTNNPDSPLSVYGGTTNQPTLYGINNSGGTAGSFTSAGTSTPTLVVYAGTGVNNLAIQATGRVTITGAAYCTGGAWTGSDLRLKNSIKTIKDPLQKVVSLRGVNFKWNDTVKYSTGEQIGFIAQETRAILPEVVDTFDNYLAVNYAPITALLVEAMKEQQQQIDSLRTTITLLKNDHPNSINEDIEMNGIKNLIYGKTEIELKKSFKDVDIENDLTVNLTPKGECNGLFVATIKNGIVTIKELGNGKSNAGFYYSIKASKSNQNKTVGLGLK